MSSQTVNMALPQSPSPIIKFEHSPAESFLSIPGDNYSSLFDVATPTSNTLNPMEVMTPKSFTEEHAPATNPVDKAQTALGTPPDSPVPEKKPSKKRKSWGQVLPEPKTNLPPRYAMTGKCFHSACPLI